MVERIYIVEIASFIQTISLHDVQLNTLQEIQHALKIFQLTGDKLTLTSALE